MKTYNSVKDEHY